MFFRKKSSTVPTEPESASKKENEPQPDASPLPPPAEAVEKEPPKKKKKRTKGIGKLIATLLALLLLMWGYVLMGATLFTLIEGYSEENFDGQAHRFKLLYGTIEKLKKLHGTDFTASNSTFESEVRTVLLEHEKILEGLLQKADESHANDWTYDSSLLYAATLVTSIGYGNIAPKTSIGRLVTIAYSCVGIPLTLICIGMLGTIMARGFKAVSAFLFEDVVTDKGEPYIPLKVSIGIMFSYLLIGAVLFRTVGEDWTFLEAFYFCFITLSTIGLGDFVYGESASRDSNFLASVIYILFGLSMLSMCFSLIQEQVSYKINRVSTMIIAKSYMIKNWISDRFSKTPQK